MVGPDQSPKSPPPSPHKIIRAGLRSSVGEGPAAAVRGRVSHARGFGEISGVRDPLPKQASRRLNAICELAHFGLPWGGATGPGSESIWLLVNRILIFRVRFLTPNRLGSFGVNSESSRSSTSSLGVKVGFKNPRYIFFFENWLRFGRAIFVRP